MRTRHWPTAQVNFRMPCTCLGVGVARVCHSNASLQIEILLAAYIRDPAAFGVGADDVVALRSSCNRRGKMILQNLQCSLLCVCLRRKATPCGGMYGQHRVGKRFPGDVQPDRVSRVQDRRKTRRRKTIRAGRNLNRAQSWFGGITCVVCQQSASWKS